MKFLIGIEETIVEKFEIEAKNSEEALEIAQRKYKKGELILEPGEVQFKQIAIIEPIEETHYWMEF